MLARNGRNPGAPSSFILSRHLQAGPAQTGPAFLFATLPWLVVDFCGFSMRFFTLFALTLRRLRGKSVTALKE